MTERERSAYDQGESQAKAGRYRFGLSYAIAHHVNAVNVGGASDPQGTLRAFFIGESDALIAAVQSPE